MIHGSSSLVSRCQVHVSLYIHWRVPKTLIAVLLWKVRVTQDLSDLPSVPVKVKSQELETLPRIEWTRDDMRIHYLFQWDPEQCEFQFP
jgi:hypothetical protein